MASHANRQRLVQVFFFGVFILLLYQVALMIMPFFASLLGAGLLALLFFPVHARVLAKVKEPRAAAALSSAGILLGIVVPVILVGWLFTKEAARMAPAAQEWLAGRQRLSAQEVTAQLPPIAAKAWRWGQDMLDRRNLDLQEILVRNLEQLAAHSGTLAARLVRNLILLLFNLTLLVASLYYFLRDGPAALDRLKELVPMAAEHKELLLRRGRDTMLAVVRGVLIISAAQGLLAGVGLALFGVPFPILLGTLTGFVAPIPFIGVGAVMVPLIVCLFLAGMVQKSLWVALWAIGVVGTIDNILRPFLISAQARLPVLLLFFGILGGLRAYGPAGVLIGPLLVALGLAFVHIYREEYDWAPKPPAALDK